MKQIQIFWRKKFKKLSTVKIFIHKNSIKFSQNHIPSKISKYHTEFNHQNASCRTWYKAYERCSDVFETWNNIIIIKNYTERAQNKGKEQKQHHQEQEEEWTMRYYKAMIPCQWHHTFKYLFKEILSSICLRQYV